MNKNLIFKLSLLGLGMAFATVFIIPSNVEPFIWLVIFIVSAYAIARECSSRFFLHGFLTSLANCVWVTTVHVLMYDTYIIYHQEEAAMLSTGPLATHPRLMMLITGPIIGIISGIVLGFLSWIASKLVKRPAEPAHAKRR
jgi:uncharacterized membrane protein